MKLEIELEDPKQTVEFLRNALQLLPTSGASFTRQTIKDLIEQIQKGMEMTTTKPEQQFYSATVKDKKKTKVICYLSEGCQNTFEIVDGVDGVYRLPRHDLKDLTPLTLATANDAVIQGVTREELYNFAWASQKQTAFMQEDGRGYEVRDRYIEVRKIILAQLSEEVNGYITETLTRNHMNAEMNEFLHGKDSPAKVEVTLTEELRKWVESMPDREWLVNAISQGALKPNHVRAIQFVRDTLLSQLSPMPEPTEFGAVVEAQSKQQINNKRSLYVNVGEGLWVEQGKPQKRYYFDELENPTPVKAGEDK